MCNVFKYDLNTNESELIIENKENYVYFPKNVSINDNYKILW